jgi:hypothetical protein
MKFLYPLDPRTKVTFTYQDHVDYKAKFGLINYNGGIDFGCPDGTPLQATAAGMVLFAGLDSTGYGNYIKIDHEQGYMSLYGHMSRRDVKAGQVVAAAQMIGLSGWSGNVRPPGPGGAHLHFECRINNCPFDPMPYLTAEPVLFKGSVIASWGVSVRIGPGKEFARDGAGIPYMTPIDISEVRGNWAALWPGHNRWVCVEDQGTKLIALEPTGEKPSPPDDTTPPADLNYTDAEKLEKVWIDYQKRGGQ